MSSDKITVLITGSNQGIGLAAARILAASASPLYHVFLCSRDLHKGKEAAASISPVRGTVETIQLDITDERSIDAAVKHISITVGKLDVLVNNAGIFVDGKMDIMKAMRETFETNTFGAVAMTEAFLPLLQKSLDPRLIFVTSGLGSMTFALDKDHPHSGYNVSTLAYRSSKAAMNMAMAHYHTKYGKDARDVKDDVPIKTWTLCPGYRSTNLNNYQGTGGVEEAGQLIVDLVLGKRDNEVGRFVAEDAVYPW